MRLPSTEPLTLGQGEAWFVLAEAGQELRLPCHDFDATFRRPDPYERLLFQRLQCSSPRKAHERDRPHATEVCFAVDMAAPDGSTRRELEPRDLDCLICIAAPGFCDLPVRGFVNSCRRPLYDDVLAGRKARPIEDASPHAWSD